VFLTRLQNSKFLNIELTNSTKLNISFVN